MRDQLSALRSSTSVFRTQLNSPASQLVKYRRARAPIRVASQMNHKVSEFLPALGCRAATKFHGASDAIGGTSHCFCETLWMHWCAGANVIGPAGFDFSASVMMDQ
jgi:hypothetical protein